MQDQVSWYDAAFGADYALVYAQRDEREARAEVEALLERGLEAPFIDLGCGAGRHLLAARELGLAGIGVDRSPAQLQMAGASQRLAGSLIRGDVRQLPFADASFACAVSLFSSFGYFDEAGDLAHLREAARVLRRGGTFFLDIADPATVRDGLVPESERLYAGGRIHERRWLSDDGRRVRKQVRIELPGRPPRGWIEDLALYEAAEFTQLLDEAGFDLEQRWDASSAQLEAPPRPRQVLRACRR